MTMRLQAVGRVLLKVAGWVLLAATVCLLLLVAIIEAFTGLDFSGRRRP